MCGLGMNLFDLFYFYFYFKNKKIALEFYDSNPQLVEAWPNTTQLLHRFNEIII